MDGRFRAPLPEHTSVSFKVPLFTDLETEKTPEKRMQRSSFSGHLFSSHKKISLRNSAIKKRSIDYLLNEVKNLKEVCSSAQNACHYAQIILYLVDKIQFLMNRGFLTFELDDLPLSEDESFVANHSEKILPNIIHHIAIVCYQNTRFFGNAVVRKNKYTRSAIQLKSELDALIFSFKTDKSKYLFSGTSFTISNPE